MSLDTLVTELKEKYGLKHLFYNDPKNFFLCTPDLKSRKLSHLQKCVLQTRCYPILNQYIDLYLETYPSEIDYQNKSGYTALMIASSFSNLHSTDETVDILLKHGADLNIQSKTFGYTALILAGMYSGTSSSIETVKKLISHGADVNIKDHRGYNVLMNSLQCYANSSDECILLLIDSDCDLNVKNKDGYTAFTLAYKYLPKRNNYEILNKFMDKDIDFTVKLHNDSNAIKYLCSTSNFDLYYNEAIDIIDKLVERDVDINQQDVNGWSALMTSINSSYNMRKIHLIQHLIDKGADLNVKNKRNQPSIIIAAYLKDTNISMAIMELLINNGANIHDLNQMHSKLVSMKNYPKNHREIEFIQFLESKGLVIRNKLFDIFISGIILFFLIFVVFQIL